MARRVLAGAPPEGSADLDRVAAAERICERIAAGLARWFGAFGSSALVGRALARARAEDSVLAKLTMTESGLGVSGFAASAKDHGADAALSGAALYLAVLFDLLARLIGTDLATALVEQSAAGVPDGPPASSAEPAAPRVSPSEAPGTSAPRQKPKDRKTGTER